MPANGEKQMITHREDGYAENMFRKLNVYRKENRMIDITIVVEGQEFGAHRIVMATASDSKIFEESQSRIVLNNSNVTIRGFLPLLEFAYTSVLNVPQCDVTDVFLSAVHLHMEKVSDFLRPYTSLTNVSPTVPGNSTLPLLQSPDILRLLLAAQYGPQGLDPHGAQLLLRQLQLLQGIKPQKPEEPQGSCDTSCGSNDDKNCCDNSDEQIKVETMDEIEPENEKPRNDSGVSSEDKSSEEWQDLQKLYGQKPDSNGNSNNNSLSSVSMLNANPLNTSLPGHLPVTAMETDDSIPAPGTIVGRTRTGKPLTQPDLPELPKTGQYMSVRRRTLQTSVPKPHVCQICGSRFTRYHNLKQHIKLHSGVKPYECDICGKRFTRNYTLRLHKMKHGGGQQFQCGSCSYTGSNAQEFKTHLRMHQHHPANSAPSQAASFPSIPDTTTFQRYNAFDPSMLGPGVNSLLALAAQQNQPERSFLPRGPNPVAPETSQPVSPTISYDRSSPLAQKSDSGVVDDVPSDGEASESLQIDESENPPTLLAQTETIEEVQV